MVMGHVFKKLQVLILSSLSLKHISTGCEYFWLTNRDLPCFAGPAPYFNGSPNEYVNTSNPSIQAKRHRNYLTILSAPPQPASPLQVLQRDSVSVKQPDENQQGQQGGLLMMLACVTSTKCHVLWRYGQVREGGGGGGSGDNKKRINRYKHAARGNHPGGGEDDEMWTKW